MNSAFVDRVAGFLETRMSRRSVFVRSAFVGSAVAVGGTEFVLRPQSAYAAICICGNPGCGCGSTCCDGFSEFCCVLNGGYNYCPSNSVIGGWWKADGSAYCVGPRYYMDCNATCNCTTGCGNGYQFCDTDCDGVGCDCAGGDCGNWVTGCFQFRYGQCNQDVACMGRIVCRVVSCVAPWEIDSTCTTTNAQDDSTANMNAPCNTAVPAPPPTQLEEEVPTPITLTSPQGTEHVFWIRPTDGHMIETVGAPWNSYDHSSYAIGGVGSLNSLELVTGNFAANDFDFRATDSKGSLWQIVNDHKGGDGWSFYQLA
ncbi:MAG TPA: hypothetical protein VMR97_10850 [Acidimicrobiales bacterium]|nr:hypothetical protein [Acidimicrobiales bacterium]